MRLFPSSRKRYLTGADWMIHAIDHMTRRATGVGNVSQVVLELNGRLSGEAFEGPFRDFLSRLPVVSGRSRRALNLCPYWYVPARTDLESIPVTAASVGEGEDRRKVFELLSRSANAPFRHPRQHLALTLVGHGEKTYLAMQFDHKLLDARGAESFLARFDAFADGSLPDPSIVCAEPAHLDDWIAKFDSGQKVNRMFIRLREGGSTSAMPVSEPVGEPLESAFAFKTYSPAEAAAISERADGEVGYLLMMPYLLGATASCVHRMFTRCGARGDHYVVPVNMDGRTPGNAEDQLFFNHMSFAYFKLAAETASDVRSVWDEVKAQFYGQVKDRLMHHVAQAGMLMRILPPGLLAKFLRLMARGEVASFSFSYLSESGYERNSLMGLDVENIYHMPRVPAPPGTGAFFTTFKGKLNVVFSSLRGTVPEKETDSFMRDLDSVLRGDDAGG